MKYEEPYYPPGEIDRAGRHLSVLEDFYAQFNPDFGPALDVVENWRASHAYPMLVIRQVLGDRAKRIDPRAIVAQRLKRFDSIIAKLKREPKMKLSQMQDLGGCRAILTNVELAERLERVHLDAWSKNPRRNEVWRSKDYIKEPKPSGYRGIHIIYKYRAQSDLRAMYDGMRVEVQIRSRKQHIWATAVEVVGTFKKELLKAGEGDGRWRRLFALMGSVHAATENRPPVPDTPCGVELYGEIRELSEEIRAEEFLSACTKAADQLPVRIANAAAYLLVLNVASRITNVRPFLKMDEANVAYNEAERLNRGRPELQTVLVSVDSLAALKTAYPNYYLDASAFLIDLRSVLFKERAR